MTVRNQSVRIGCETSEPCLVSYGEPQESILGPELFNNYISDLPSVLEVKSLESYFDDSQLYLSSLVKAVHNFVARIVSGTRKFVHVTPIPKQLQ